MVRNGSRYFIMLGVPCFATGFFARRWLDSTLSSQKHSRSADTSQISVAITSQIQAKALVSSYVANRLDAEETTLREHAAQVAQKAVDSAFIEVHSRVPLFAEWYFAYPTTYRLVSAAVSGMTKGNSTAEVERYITHQYELLVVRPSSLEEALQRSAEEAVHEMHSQYVALVLRLEGDARGYLEEQTSHLSTPPPVMARWEWDAVLRKIPSVTAQFEKAPELSTGIILGGMMAGKAGGAALGTKLAAPFMTKLLPASALLLGGPLGAAAGVMVDYVLSSGMALMQRPHFEEEVHRAITITENEWLASPCHKI